MKKTHLTFIAIAALAIPAFAQEKEKSVAFVTADKKYITTATGGALDLTGTKIGSKQAFTLIDVNGGDLADGDDVQIRYTPGAPAGGTPSKSNYWRETKDGLKRGDKPDTFKLKKVESKYAFQTPSGKFVAAPATEGGPLTITDAQDKALLVDIVDAPAATTTTQKKPKESTEEKPATE